MSTTDIPAAPPLPAVDVEKPKHRLSELTTYELRDYREELEKAISFVDQQRPAPAARAALEARLDAVLAEQDDRKRIARA